MITNSQILYAIPCIVCALSLNRVGILFNCLVGPWRYMGPTYLKSLHNPGLFDFSVT